MALLACALLTGNTVWAQTKQPVDYVNPYIGNISHLLVPTFATVQLPNSMLRVYPARADYTSEQVIGLPVIVTNHRERSAFSISPYLGNNPQPVVASTWDNEHITPYSFDIELADNTIAARYAVAPQSAIYDIEPMEQGKPFYIMVNSQRGAITMGDRWVSGYQQVTDGTRVYIYAEVDAQPVEAGILKDGKVEADKKAEGSNACAAMRFADGTKKVSLRYGVSFISSDQAKKNLYREQNGFNLAAVKKAGRETWNTTLSKISVTGGSDDQKTVLYTSYYRTFERPVCLSEDGRYFSAYDGKVHEDGGTRYARTRQLALYGR